VLARQALPKIGVRWPKGRGPARTRPDVNRDESVRAGSPCPTAPGDAEVSRPKRGAAPEPLPRASRYAPRGGLICPTARDARGDGQATAGTWPAGQRNHSGAPAAAARAPPVPQFVLDELSIQCQGKARGDLVFPGRDGGYLPRPKSSTGRFQAAVKRAGVQKTTPHDLATPARRWRSAPG
jgi:hypothetical protein